MTLVEFSDFQCPFSASIVPTLKELERRFGDKIRIVFRDFPLKSHKAAARLAEAAQCAHDQGRFWPMHDRLFQSQKTVETVDLAQMAVEVGLEKTAFAACLDSGKHAAEWRKDMQDGTSYGVTGTPMTFVNGRPVAGAQSVEAMTAIVEEELRSVGGK